MERGAHGERRGQRRKQTDGHEEGLKANETMRAPNATAQPQLAPHVLISGIFYFLGHTTLLRKDK
jgi:hypothetical protein